ncbi:MAG: amidohydrolase family protein [Burkholderiales bacterium]
MTTPRLISVERGADCHAHVFCGDRFPFAEKTVYRPHPSQSGTAREFLSVLDAHGFTHGLLVGANPYGLDNRCLLDAIASSSGRFKGIALVGHDCTERELADLTAQGVVGCRINLFNQGLSPLTDSRAPAFLGRLREAGWYVQIQCEKDQLAEVAPILKKARVTIMIDHFGRPDIARGVKQPGFQTLLEFGRSGYAIVKLSGPFRSSLEPYPHYDVDPFMEAAIEAYTLDRCVWGSDWPFVRIDARMDYGPALSCLGRWLPDAADRNKVLWETPARLFGFS